MVFLSYFEHFVDYYDFFYYHSCQKYMPDLAGLFSHILVDVSSIKALCIRWYPRGKISFPISNIVMKFAFLI